MGSYEFAILNDNEKADALWKHGIFLMNRFEDGYSINLYSLFDFFVEAWYDDKKIAIRKFRHFKSINCLEPYIDQIDLNLLKD